MIILIVKIKHNHIETVNRQNNIYTNVTAK